MSRTLSALLLSLLVFGLALTASAKGAAIEDTLGGTIIVSSKYFPKTLPGAPAMKKLNEKGFAYDKDGKLTFHYMIFLKKADVIDVAADMVLYDVTDGLPGTVSSATTFFSTDRSQRIYAANLSLDEASTKGDRKYRLVFSYQGRIIARSSEFFVKAKEVKRDGKVEFTEEETKGGK
jgi:hypothetical protein